jgi:hypothetical protein
MSDNSTDIPNILIDKWMPLITPAEFKVVLSIYRQSLKSNDVSLPQIVKNTGLSRQGVIKCLKNLEINYNLIKKIGSKPKVYYIIDIRSKIGAVK